MRQESPATLRKFRAELLALTLTLGIAFALLVLVALPILLRSSWVGLPPHTAALAVKIVPVLAWLAIPGFLVGLYSTWTMSEGGHANTLFEGMPAVAILLAVLLFIGIEPLVWGTLIGTALQLALLALPSIRRGDLDLPALPRPSAEWALFGRGFGIMILGQAIMSFTTVIDQFFAARLGGGSISALGYANRIVALALGIVATAVTRATLPVFSRTSALAASETRRLAVRLSRMMFLVGVGVAGLGWILAPLVVRILFQRGTFSAGDTVVVAGLLRYGLLHLPFYFASLVLGSLHSSLRHYKVLLATGVLGLSMKVLVSALLIGPLGVSALMISLVAVYAANMALMAKTLPR